MYIYWCGIADQSVSAEIDCAYLWLGEWDLDILQCGPKINGPPTVSINLIKFHAQAVLIKLLTAGSFLQIKVQFLQNEQQVGVFWAHTNGPKPSQVSGVTTTWSPKGLVPCSGVDIIYWWSIQAPQSQRSSFSWASQSRTICITLVSSH